MMTLKTLSLQNFKRYATYEMIFEEGLCGILGRNGSGKSTIFEAVFFALYGEYKNKELLKTAGTEGNVKVELTFFINEKEYTVIREFRGRVMTAYASLKCGDETITTGAKEVTIAITKLLGMGKEAFLHTVFASQKELTALSSMKNDDRKTMMRRLLGLEKIDKIEGLIRDTLRDLNRDIKNESAQLMSEEALKALQIEQSTKEQALKALEVQIKALEAEQQKIKLGYEHSKAIVDLQQKAKETKAQKLQAVTKAEQSITIHQQQLKSLEEELKALQLQQSAYEKDLPLKVKLSTLDKALNNQDSLKTAFLKKDALEKELAQLRIEFTHRKNEVASLSKEIEPLEVLKKQIIEQQTTLTQHKASLQIIETAMNDIKTLIATQNAKLTETKEKVEGITKLGRESACPVCTRPLIDQYDNVLASLTKEMNDVISKQIADATKSLHVKIQEHQAQQKCVQEAERIYNATNTQIALLTSKTQDLAKAQKLFSEVETRGKANKQALDALGVIAYDEKAHEQIKIEHKALKAQVDELLKLEALIETIPFKITTLTALQKQLTEEEKELKALQKILSADAYKEEVHTKAIEEASRIEKQKDAHTEEMHKMALEQSNIIHSIEALKKEIAQDTKAREALKAKEKDQSDYIKLKEIMAEFKTHINARVAPRIGEVASEMFVRITRGKYQHIEVSPEFDFFIYDNGVKYPIERFSGGEIDLANLVLRIAISKTLGELSGSGNIGFLAFDEVFGSQDEERRIRIMEAFHTISESYRQIFLISHETEIKEMFERVVEF
ncbi:AAA family ATPase [Sulfurospirillum cavolei]|uniref:AAA family ATPase n=1 Tax=Sulfurospirillum cavolei TaxID=366522 RepID=UPI000694AC8A|nr:SMC family ATPase [Sulfurospirillum cavolei]